MDRDREMRVPAALRKGDLIAMLAPASAVKREYCEGAAELLRRQGYRVRLYPSCGSESGSYSAPFGQRLSELREALEDQEVKGIFCGRGGYGCVQLVDSLPALPAGCAKWVIGFSDISALHAYMQSNGVMSLHAPMAKHLTLLPEDDPSTRALLATLAEGRQQPMEYPTHEYSSPGEGCGRLSGGNLAVLNGLAATPYDILGRVKEEPSILFIEDISEAIYAVERMLYRLKMQGVLEKAKGIVVGHFTEYRPDRNYSTMEEMISRRLKEWGIWGKIPVAFGFPAGHKDDNHPLLLGGRVRLRVTEQSTLLEPLG